MPNKKLTRTCIGCKEKKNKQEMIRIIKNKENEIKVDLKQNLEGRGAYICKDENCFQNAQKRNSLRRALKTNIENKKYEELRGVMFDRAE